MGGTKSTDEMKGLPSPKGLMYIFEILENFFEFMDKSIKYEREEKEDLAVEMLFRRIKEGKKFVNKGKKKTRDIQKELNSLNTLLNNIPSLGSSFTEARDGLKGVSDVAEEATLTIQDSSMSIQDSLDKVNDYLSQLESADKFDDDKKNILHACVEEISSVADTAFNIMTALQFHDILRQQISAIDMVLSKAKSKIAKSIGKLEGEDVDVKEEEYMVATDQSILGEAGDQDAIDLLISSVKEEKKDKE